METFKPNVNWGSYTGLQLWMASSIKFSLPVLMGLMYVFCLVGGIRISNSFLGTFLCILVCKGFPLKQVLNESEENREAAACPESPNYFGLGKLEVYELSRYSATKHQKRKISQPTVLFQSSLLTADVT